MSYDIHKGIGAFLTTEEEIFLLSLHLEAPERSNMDYIRQLDLYYRKNGVVGLYFRLVQ